MIACSCAEPRLREGSQDLLQIACTLAVFVRSAAVDDCSRRPLLLLVSVQYIEW